MNRWSVKRLTMIKNVNIIKKIESMTWGEYEVTCYWGSRHLEILIFCINLDFNIKNYLKIQLIDNG